MTSPSGVIRLVLSVQNRSTTIASATTEHNRMGAISHPPDLIISNTATPHAVLVPPNLPDRPVACSSFDTALPSDMPISFGRNRLGMYRNVLAGGLHRDGAVHRRIQNPGAAPPITLYNIGVG